MSQATNPETETSVARTYPSRALATLLVAIIPGSLLGGFWIAAMGLALAVRYDGYPKAVERAKVTFLSEFLAGSAVAAPFSLIVGLVAAWIVWKSGRINIRKTIAVATFAPLPFVFIFGPFGALTWIIYLVPGLLTALILRSAGLWAARRFCGVTA